MGHTILCGDSTAQGDEDTQTPTVTQNGGTDSYTTHFFWATIQLFLILTF